MIKFTLTILKLILKIIAGYFLLLIVGFTFAYFIIYYIVESSNKLDVEKIHEKCKNEPLFQSLKLYKDFTYVSNHQDTFSFKIVNIKSEIDINNSIGGPAKYYYYDYNIHVSKCKQNTKFVGMQTDSEYPTIIKTVYLLGGTFNLEPGTKDSLNGIKDNNFRYKNNILNDVYVSKSNYYGEPSYSKTNIIWWSKKLGLVQFKTGKDKIWVKI